MREAARRREPSVWIIVITVTLSGEKTAGQNRKCARVKWISVMVRYAHRGNTHWHRQRENVINSLLERGKEAWQNGWKVQKNVAFQLRHPTAMSSRCEVYFQRSSALVANCARWNEFDRFDHPPIVKKIMRIFSNYSNTNSIINKFFFWSFIVVVLYYVISYNAILIFIIYDEESIWSN